MSDIVDFIAARLDGHEQYARAALGRNSNGTWEVRRPAGAGAGVHYVGESEIDGNSYVTYDSEGLSDSFISPEVGAFIAEHDPSMVLLMVRSLRAVLDLHDSGEHDCIGYGGVPPDDNPAYYPCQTLRWLASIWIDHPDFESDWAI